MSEHSSRASEPITGGNADERGTLWWYTSIEGWAGIAQAARALEVSALTVRRLVESGELESRVVQVGPRRALEVSLRSLRHVRNKRIAEARLQEALG